MRAVGSGISSLRPHPEIPLVVSVQTRTDCNSRAAELLSCPERGKLANGGLLVFFVLPEFDGSYFNQTESGSVDPALRALSTSLRTRTEQDRARVSRLQGSGYGNFNGGHVMAPAPHR